ncbi:hydroxydechloroatrazine ethylaminohydrolase [Clostridium botulinum]|uniref:8-oxoguanine deaminase n=1 Tax=Clostridium botulinum TaxID=1491 RepID=UPI000174E7FD|nr:8-oxoguanine deaminase [Clostridium botulinum]ACD53147.1 hydroxydechloroatrazine ethylaminohydrolase [Clostridium botulinum E3 str. Alaska E43]AJF28626.1 hydroxydechloroatrazine ethylaminohydrolase [Clostridium botulinum]AJF31687.1 hydroxydechloroatrazine ethylaminohydrolase [Clostridium botulinum]MBY6790254.1 8-oxoguanine deaminase [Clostridium botulinum]MBY6817791.1 8-oxoguanine deaminase [Clostridium botulinum]
MNKTLFIKNIKSLISCDEKDSVYEDVNIFVENGVIKYIGKDLYEANEIIDATNMLVYPGLINTHHHLYQTFTRNLPQVQRLELFPWLIYLYEIWKAIDSEIIRYSSLVGMGELMKNGCTTCFDHHYVFPKSEEEKLIDTQFSAAKELGIRMYASRGSMSLSKKDGGLPPDSVVQTIDKILYDSERVVKKFHNPNKFSMNQVALAPCSPFSVTSDLMKETANLARKLGVRLHTHLAETIDEERFIAEKFGMRPLEYMESLGWVGEDVWYAHGIHFNDEELRILAKTKTGVAHCPISNMKLSSGIAKIPQMIKLGIPVGLAVDGSASNDGSNLLEEIRVCYLLHRLNSSNYAPTGYEILKLATRGSADVLGRNDIGELSVGKAADLFMINSKRLEFVGTQFDPKSILGTVGIKGNVDYTIVSGEIVVKEGKLINIDEEKITYEANKLVERLISKA